LEAVTVIIRSLNLSRVKIEFIGSIRNEGEDLLARKEYADHLMRIILARENFCYIDEMAINQWMGRGQVWSIGGRPIGNAMAGLKKESLLLVAVMDNFGSVEFDFIHGGASDSNY
jgi:hypothetical protein